MLVAQAMRTTCLFVFVAASSVLVAACSGDPDSSGLRRSTHDTSAEEKGGGGTASPARSPEASSQQPSAPSAPSGSTGSATPSAPATPATPLAKGVCENPTCTQSNGAWTCLAKDTEGTPVEMDCQFGVCTCFTGDQGTAQVPDDGMQTEGDARTIFAANCQCL